MPAFQGGGPGQPVSPQVQQNAVPLVATCDVGAYRLLDITHQYVNPHLPTESRHCSGMQFDANPFGVDKTTGDKGYRITCSRELIIPGKKLIKMTFFRKQIHPIFIQI